MVESVLLYECAAGQMRKESEKICKFRRKNISRRLNSFDLITTFDTSRHSRHLFTAEWTDRRRGKGEENRLHSLHCILKQ